MTPQKRSSGAATVHPGPPRVTGRRPWKKKTPVEVVLEQADKLRQQIVEREQELEGLRQQLRKFEAACKIFEAP